jgi:hypothetical protein
MVLGYREETTLVDFKLTFADEDEKWLDITKDVMAFANTDGGYLAFGVKDKSFELMGLEAATCALLSDTNNWLQKLNRYVEPHFTALRCRTAELDGKQFAVVFIPPSAGRTHVVSKDATIKGTQKVVLRQGTFYVRRSGAVHLADARDFDAVVDRRLDHVRSSLLDKIAQVVKAPADTDVIVVKKQAQQGLEQTFVVQDAADGVAIKGQTFSISPKTPEQAVAQWISMTAVNPGDVPSADTLWKWYRGRKTMELTRDQSLKVAAYSLLREVPFFYWLQECSADRIKEMLTELMERKPGISVLENVMGASAFLGKRFFQSQVGKLGALAKRVGVVFPDDGPRSLYRLHAVGKGGKADPQALEADLDQIAKLATVEPTGIPELTQRWRAGKLDCYLYAQDDQYKSSEKAP